MSLRGKWLALAMLLCAQPAIADNPRKVAIGPGSPKGALLFKVPPYPNHQLLLFIRPGANDPSYRTYRIGIDGRPPAKGDQFIVETLPPGRYVLESVYQQNKWAACLDANTFTVSIEPGKIAYLGMLDARPTLASIQRSAQAENELKASTFQWHFYRKNVVAPVVSDRDQQGLERAESFVRESMPKSAAAATLANLEWGPFVRSGELSGMADRCDWELR